MFQSSSRKVEKSHVLALHLFDISKLVAGALTVSYGATALYDALQSAEPCTPRQLADGMHKRTYVTAPFVYFQRPLELKGAISSVSETMTFPKENQKPRVFVRETRGVISDADGNYNTYSSVPFVCTERSFYLMKDNRFVDGQRIKITGTWDNVTFRGEVID